MLRWIILRIPALKRRAEHATAHVRASRCRSYSIDRRHHAHMSFREWLSFAFAVGLAIECGMLADVGELDVSPVKKSGQ